MLTAKQERFCQNLEVKKMSQRAAYLDAYPNANNWKPNVVDVKACNLANEDNIMVRRKELRDEQNDIIKAEAKWTRENAYNTLIDLIKRAQNEYRVNEELSSPCVSAIINGTKELNAIYGVGEEADGKGVLADILAAVKGVSDD